MVIAQSTEKMREELKKIIGDEADNMEDQLVKAHCMYWFGGGGCGGCENSGCCGPL